MKIIKGGNGKYGLIVDKQELLHLRGAVGVTTYQDRRNQCIKHLKHPKIAASIPEKQPDGWHEKVFKPLANACDEMLP